MSNSSDASSAAEKLAALLASPALQPPPGVTPDFDDPANNNGLAWFVLTSCMAVATVCFLLRAYARIYLQRKLHMEEGRSNSSTTPTCRLTVLQSS